MTEHDIATWIGQTKRELRANADVEKAFADSREAMQREADVVREANARGQSVVPEIPYASIASGQVDSATRGAVRQRGCVIVRGVFERQQAENWNQELGEYLESNDYIACAKAKAGLDTYFGDLADSAPQIYGVYWSRPQVMARQARSMAVTKRWLNNLWDTRAPAGAEFDPEHDYAYADRTRRRTPGDNTLGLSPHMDAGSYERWVDPAFRQIYAAVFAGHLEAYDPWRAAYRTQTREFESPAVSSMFRTFQGWTALTAQGPGDGTLELVPIGNAIGYVLLRALQDDVGETELPLAKPGRALGVDTRWHPELLNALVPIPLVEPGDTVWWHPDVIHAVGNEHKGSDFANVIYIGASPACRKNHTYALRQREAFLAGRSAPDFAAEDHEVDFIGRATLDDLSDLGRQQMAL